MVPTGFSVRHFHFGFLHRFLLQNIPQVSCSLLGSRQSTEMICN
nr:MAG TPA: hypothetical protein [Caudoviricetes sp.]